MKVRNELGRVMEMSCEDFKRSALNGLKFTVVDEDIVIVEEKEKIDDVEHKKIGVMLQRHRTGERHCASDRIRGEWVMKYSENMEEYVEGVDYEAIIFHYPSEKISSFKGVKILDICDDIWKRCEKDFLERISRVDAITVPTEGLKKELSLITEKNIFVIPDGHDFEHYVSREKNKHDRKAKNVIWFGYAKNFHPVKPLLDEINKLGLKLKVIAECPVDEGDFSKWNIDTYIKEISKCDFAVLPKNGNYKSNNKTITALLSGIPVAKNKSDIKRLVSPTARRKELKKHEGTLKEYDSSLRAKEYEKLIEEVKARKPVIYTAINGNYEKDRNDIVVFRDRISDKFKQPVMNAKVYKVLSHKFVDSEIIVWIDGNVYPLENSESISKLLEDNDIALFKHPHRNCIYQESYPAKQRVSEEYKELIDEQMKTYENEGMPAGFGLWECGVLIRRNNEVTQELNERWWAEICRYSQRDQLSFPYVVWKMGKRLKLKTLEGNVRNHKLFRYVNHSN